MKIFYGTEQSMKLIKSKIKKLTRKNDTCRNSEKKEAAILHGRCFVRYFSWKSYGENEKYKPDTRRKRSAIS